MKSLAGLAARVLLLLGVSAAVALTLNLNQQEGYERGYEVAKSEGEVALGKLRLEVANEKKEAAESAAKELAAEKQRGDVLALQLTNKSLELRKNTERLTGEIQRVTTLYRRTLDAPPQPLPVAVFTVGFVRVWNQALTSDAMPASQSTSRTASEGGGAGAVEQLAAGITPADLLTNHVRNSESFAKCRAQLNSLIEWNTHGRN